MPMHLHLHLRYPKPSNWVQKIKELASIGRWKEVISCHLHLKQARFPCPDPSFFPPLLKASASVSIRLGMSIHADILKMGLYSFIPIGNSIVDFYARCGLLVCSRNAFSHMEKRDSVSWNIVVHSHLHQGAFDQGLALLSHAKIAKFEPNISTLVLVVQACSKLGCFGDTLVIHGYLMSTGFMAASSVQNSLLSAYASLELNLAQKLFVEMFDRDVIAWSVMIGCHLQHDQPDVALHLFRQMLCDHKTEVDGQVVVTVLKACTQLRTIEMGYLIHALVIRRGISDDVFVGNSLIDFYSKRDDLEFAFTVFDDMPVRNVVSWNSLMHGLIKNENYSEALLLFKSMENAGDLFDEITMVNMLQACKAMANLSLCKSIHCKVIRQGYESNEIVTNCLIDTYAKCNCIVLSWRLFIRIKQRDEVTWTTMIAAFVQCGNLDEAIAVFRDMYHTKVNPNAITFLHLIEACSLSAELKKSKWAHGLVIRHGLASEVTVGTSVVHMYSKCGAIEASRKAFEQIREKNIVSWSAMIAAYGMNGLARDALALHAKMRSEGMKPNLVTTLSLLCACSHGGLVEEGLSLFKDLVAEYGGELGSEHYSCAVDLLARAGWLESAFDFIRGIPGGVKSEASAWGALLSGCKRFTNVEVGSITASRVVELEPLSSSGYLLASSMYAAGESWSDAARMRRLVDEKAVSVLAGYSVSTQ